MCHFQGDKQTQTSSFTVQFSLFRKLYIQAYRGFGGGGGGGELGGVTMVG